MEEQPKLLNYNESPESERKNFVVEEISHLSEIDSLSTQEQKLRHYLEDRGKKFSLETKIDEKGNLWFLSDKPEGDILFCAHMDKVGPGIKLEKQEDEIIGRLDDTIGLGIILSVLQEGHRPSVLFTVEEESQTEVRQDDGTIVMKSRDLKGNIYNAGARFATDQMFDDVPLKPKLIVTIDVSASGKSGAGPFLYLSYKTGDGHYFRNPDQVTKNLKSILHQSGERIRYLDGGLTDGVEFTWLARVGVGLAGVGIPIENIHSNKEVANINDITDAVKALEAIIVNRNQLIAEVDVPLHTNRPGPKIDV